MKKRIEDDNRGITLVEIIISLLILALVFTPMISAFVTANRVSRKSSELTYATTLAENVMEAVKILGNEETANQIVGNTAFTLASGESGKLSHNVASGSAVTFTGGKLDRVVGGSYVYEIKNAVEGGGTYDVRITFSAEEYTATPTPTPNPADGGVTPAASFPFSTLPNNYEYADFSAFNSKTTVLVNPNAGNSVSGDYFNTRVLSDLYELHVTYVYETYASEYNRIAIINSQLSSEYAEECERCEEAGIPTPTPPAYLDYPESPNEKTEAEFKAAVNLNKEIRLKVEPYTDPVSHQNGVVLNSTVVYNVSTAETGLLGAEDLVPREYGGFCDDSVFLNSEDGTAVTTLYLIYSPYSKDTLGTVLNVSNDKIVIDNELNQKLDIYIAAQTEKQGAGYKTLTGTLPVEIKSSGGYNTAEYISLYSNITLNPDHQVNSHNSVMKNLGTTSDRIYEVKVEVFRAGSDFSEFDKITEIDSATINY